MTNGQKGAVLALVLMGCGAGEDGASGEMISSNAPAAVQAAYLNGTMTVSQAAASSCSTLVADGLTRQLISELNCIAPGTLVSIADVPNVDFGAAAYRYMQAAPARALRNAVRTLPNRIRITSALRTLPQQLLLYRWFRAGRCGIRDAAAPDSGSNHQSGIAFDTSDAAAIRSAVTAQGFRWFGAGDPVHFDYARNGTTDLRQLSVRAFQRLWNRANPRDRIAEDGEYGPATERRLLASPLNGFAVGSACGV